MEVRGSVSNSLASCHAHGMDMFLLAVFRPLQGSCFLKARFEVSENFCGYKIGRTDRILERI